MLLSKLTFSSQVLPIAYRSKLYLYINDSVMVCSLRCVQVVITLLLISVQVIGATIWLIIEPPGVRPYHPFDRKDEASSHVLEHDS